jgi:ribosomal protein L39E
MAVAAQAKQNDLGPAFVARLERFVHRCPDRVRRFWRRQNPLSPVPVPRLDEQVFHYNNRKMNEGDRFNSTIVGSG